MTASERVAALLCERHQGASPTRQPCAACTEDADALFDTCACGHGEHLHDPEASPSLCMVCGDNTRCDYADPVEIAADRWEEGHAQGVIDYMNRYEHLLPHERVLRAVEMVECWKDNPYRADEQVTA